MGGGGNLRSPANIGRLTAVNSPRLYMRPHNASTAVNCAAQSVPTYAPDSKNVVELPVVSMATTRIPSLSLTGLPLEWGFLTAWIVGPRLPEGAQLAGIAAMVQR